MIKRAIGLLLAALLCACAAPPKKAAFDKWARYGLPPCELKTCTPDTRGDEDWWWIPYIQQRLQFQQPYKNKGLLFIGDSITDFWQYAANDKKYPGGWDVWNMRYSLIATDFGVTGDKTQNVLWRLTEGNVLENYTPKHIVLLIGINNLLQNDTPEDTAAGIQAITTYLRKALPESKVLILGVFPSGEKASDPIREKIRALNAEIKKQADFRRVYYADIGNVFLETDGSITKRVMRDLLHLSPIGYEMWANAMEPYLRAFLNDQPLPSAQ